MIANINVKFIWCVGHVIFKLFFCVCFRKRRNKERVRSAEGRRRLSNSSFSSLRASSPGRSGGGAGKRNSNPYPKPLPPFPARPPEHPVELARKLVVLGPNVIKAMGTGFYFLPTSFLGFLKPWEYPLWPDFFCVLQAMYPACRVSTYPGGSKETRPEGCPFITIRPHHL